MENFTSLDVSIYYTTNNCKEEDVYKQFYIEIIKDYIKEISEGYNKNFMPDLWLADIINLTKPNTGNQICNLSEYVHNICGISENEKATCPQDLDRGQYYLDYKDDIPYIVYRGNK